MIKIRDQRFREIQESIEKILSGDEPDKAYRLTWLFEEFLYNQKKKKVPYEVYCKIRYSPVAKTLAEWSGEFNLSASVVQRICAGTYFEWV